MRTVSALVVAMCVGTGAQTNELADVVRRVAPAVVTVHTMGFDEEGKPISSQGSGFVIRDSLIVTNHHVVENAAIATVDFADGRRLLVDLVVAADEDIDLAILTVSGALHADLSSISLSDSLPSVGDPIVVFGSPQGYSETVTHGIAVSNPGQRGNPNRRNHRPWVEWRTCGIAGWRANWCQ